MVPNRFLFVIAMRLTSIITISSTSLLLIAASSHGMGVVGDAGPKYHVLKQMRIGHDSYFVQAAAKMVMFFPKSGGHGNKTNVFAFARFVSYGSDEYGRGSLIEQWLDLGAHVHTYAILKRQMSYLAERVRISERGGSLTLSRGRPSPLTLPYLVSSGAMTKDTMLIPVYLMEITYERLFSQWEGADSEHVDRNAWRASLRAIQDHLLEYRRIVDGLPVRKATPLPRGFAYSDAADIYQGLEDVPPPTDERHVRPSYYRPDDTCGYIPDETIDIANLSAADIEALATIEMKARLAIRDASRFGATQ